jgi:non-ribosomal peptide synthetase-like protein
MDIDIAVPDAGVGLTVPPAPRALLEILDETTQRHGGRVAIDAPDARLTYRELSDAAAALADRLASRGVGPGDRVGVRVASGTAELYTAILGVLRAGAAYVPVDADDPPARTADLWDDAAACAVVEDGLGITMRLTPVGAGRELTPDDDAWVIFTSGSSGRPKGVAVSHRAAAGFVDAESRLWTVTPEDRVLAGLSVAFDASCEEMWLAWRHGAALVPAPRAVVRSGADLGPWLAERGVTVVSTVPALAAMWDGDVLAAVRLLILGGEVLPTELGWRLAADREVWNTYGPTEATVVSTAARVRPGEPILIGRPLEGWTTAVVDEAGEPVAPGEPGELVIGGLGLGRYLDPNLDAVRYAPIPALGAGRAYRSGDVVRETAAGLAFVGRRDDQVKLGGRRLELGEVDAHLTAAPGVRAGAAAVRTTPAGNRVLVGYIAGEADPEDVRAHLAEHLPTGIAPLVVVLDEIPVRTSGKVDRAALPWPPPANAGLAEGALSGTAAWLAERWTEQLGPLPMSGESDFFKLGGSSLTAAKLVSVVRARFPAVAVADVYEHRRLDALADRLDQLGEHAGAGAPGHPERSRRWGAIQLAGVLALLTIVAAQSVVAILAMNRWEGGGLGPDVAWGWIAAAWLLLFSPPARAMLVVGVRRGLLGRRIRPGRHPRRGWLACRLWFIARLTEVSRLDNLAGTPWAARYARFSGVEVGPGASLGTLPPAIGLVRIGAGATLEPDVDVHGYWVEADELVVGVITIGPGARIGTRALLMPGVTVGAGAEIEPGSVVNGDVPPGERWAGSPSRRVGDAGEHWPAGLAAPVAAHRRFWRAMYSVGLALQTVLPLLYLVPGLLVASALTGSQRALGESVESLIVAAPAMALTFVICDAVVVALTVRAASRLVEPGWHAADGRAGFALWFAEHVMAGARSALFPLFSSLYTRPWLRLAGIEVGRRSEISTAVSLNRFVSFGEMSFAADDVVFAGARARGGWLHVSRIRVGHRSFLGNGALLRGDTQVGADSLVGVLTIPPAASADGTSWLGWPALELPRVADRVDPAKTTHPSRARIAARGTVEAFRILAPATISIVLAALMLLALDTIGNAAGVVTMSAAAPFVILAGALCAVGITILAKWVLIGRYKPGEHPLWTAFVWRDEIINSFQEQLAGMWLMDSALGTPLMSAYLRALGAKVGHDVWCETLALTEFDLVSLGDGCAINRRTCVETHLFHDRLMRIGPCSIGARATLGPSSAVLPDSRVGAGCWLGGRSVVLRGEELPPGTAWHGAPVVPA